MKKMIIPALLLSTTAFANVADLNHQPKSGEFLLDAGYLAAKTDSKYVSGSTSIDVETRVALVDTAFSVGLHDKLAAKLGLSYALVNTIEIETMGKNKENGLVDPTLGLSFRAWENKGASFDLNLGALISLGEKENDAYRGGYVIKFGTDYARTFGKFEFFTALNFDYNLESKDKYATYTITADPSLDFTLEIKGQYMVSECLYLGAGFEYNVFAEVDTKDTDNDTTNTEAYKMMGVTLGGKYLASKDLAVSLDLGYAVANDLTSSEVTGGTPSSTEIEDIKTSMARVAVAYAF